MRVNLQVMGEGGREEERGGERGKRERGRNAETCRVKRAGHVCVERKR